MDFDFCGPSLRLGNPSYNTRSALCLIAGVGFTLLLEGILPTDFSPTTEMAGHALWANFNIDRFFLRFYLWMIVPGAVTFGLLVWARLENHPVLLGNSFIEPRLNKFFESPVVGQIAAWATALAPAFVLVAFRRIQIIDDSNTWQPNWPLAAPLAISVCFVLAIVDWKYKSRISLFGWIVSPTVLFLLHAKVPPSAPLLNGDFFHPGEMLVPYRLWTEGAFPWRDFLPYHGPMGNLARHIPGIVLFEQSWWGSEAGNTLVWIPLYFVGWYLWARHSFRRYPLFLLLLFFLLPIAAPFAFGRAALYHQRFFFYSMLLLLAHSVFDKKALRGALALGFATTAFVILTPEAGYLVPVVVVALALQAIYHHDGPKLIGTFLAAGLLMTVGWCLFLQENGALQAFIDYHRYHFYGYRFVYGKPPNPHHDWYGAYEKGLWLISFATMGLFIVRWRVRTLRPLDWIALVAWGFLVVYCQKFLASADEHILQVYAVSFPVTAYLLFHLWTLMCHRVRVWLPLGLTLVLVSLIFRCDGVLSTFEQFSKKFVSDRRGAVQTAVGLVRLSKGERVILEDFQKVLPVLTDDDRLLDLTDQPLLFHMLLPFDPASRFYEAIGFASPPAQKDLIKMLEHEAPEIVVYAAERGFSISRPVPPSVRYYHVSRYVLERYAPLVRLNGYLLLGRHGIDWPARLSRMPKVAGSLDREDLYRSSCDWGFIAYLWGRSIDAMSLHFAMLEIPVDAGKRGLSIDLEATEPALVTIVGLPANRMIARFHGLAGPAKRATIPLGSCVGMYDPNVQRIRLISSRPLRIGNAQWR